MKAEDQRLKIKGALVHFFREGTENDYLDALNNATDEILSLLQEQKEEKDPKDCKHEHIKGGDSCYECVDCGTRNF